MVEEVRPPAVPGQTGGYVSAAPPEKAPFDWSHVITPEAIAYAEASAEREVFHDLMGVQDLGPMLRDSAVIRTSAGPAFLLGPHGQAEVSRLLKNMHAGWPAPGGKRTEPK